jgi:hypothetical protein
LEERHRNKSTEETLLSFDIFGSPIPSFNFEGRYNFGSRPGLFATLLFTISLGTFSVLKILRFSAGENPLISEALEINFYDVTDAIDIKEIKMLGAFQVTDFYSGVPKDHPEHVEFVAKIIES